MHFLPLIGRIFFSLTFILSSFAHFSSADLHYAMAKGVPFASFLVPFSGLMALVGGLSILLGFKARYGAWLIIAFLVPVTLMMHQFWNVTEPIQAMMEKINFMKNLSLVGGACMIAYFGSGPLSLKE